MILGLYSDVVYSSNFEYGSSPIRSGAALDEESSSFVEASPRGDIFLKTRKDNRLVFQRSSQEGVVGSQKEGSV